MSSVNQTFGNHSAKYSKARSSREKQVSSKTEYFTFLFDFQF